MMKALGRLRGWPPKNAVAAVTAGCDVGIASIGVVVLPGKWRGWLPRASRLKKSGKLTGRSLGQAQEGKTIKHWAIPSFLWHLLRKVNLSLCEALILLSVFD